MRVKMITTMAGPSGTASPGQVVDVPAATAQALIKGGFAVEAPAHPVERAARRRKGEQATAAPQHETEADDEDE